MKTKKKFALCAAATTIMVVLAAATKDIYVLVASIVPLGGMLINGVRMDAENEEEGMK